MDFNIVPIQQYQVFRLRFSELTCSNDLNFKMTSWRRILTQAFEKKIKMKYKMKNQEKQE